MERVLRIRDGVVAAMEPVGAEEVAVEDAAGRWLAEDVRALRPVPPETCSAMDGYAVRAADVTGPVELPVRGAIYAGSGPFAPLAPGEAARIFTGGALPEGADAVVRQEAVKREGDRARFLAATRPGENVRCAGEDVAPGARALPAGVRLGARQLALLATVAVPRVPVRRRLRVAIVGTGDELESGRIANSNGIALAALVEALGAEPVRAIVGDRVDALAALLAARLDDCDAVITTGGVSVGERDHVPEALARIGAEVRVHGVPMKPGKPFLFAVRGGRPVFGLPGSPSACLVAFEVFARPALLARAGAAPEWRFRPSLPLALAEPTAGKPGRARLLWARLEDGGRVRPVGRDAAQIKGPALADALVALPSDAGDLPEGAPVTTWLLRD